MNVSVDISLYPLTEDFLTVVDDFIQRLRQEPDLTIKVNDLSTQVFGDYATVLNKVNAAMQATHKQTPKAAFIMKVLNGHLLDAHSDKYA
ncbi:YkoF family thiamine/hydroxymethylpyrimidine-binding protein [Marinicella gelatinilytica]|uniref:YkoF family thiamine/hydroxymethylpyrimidine-binding protein n=1 Tax=Marinicella gelatinilytica TaxID=2996017 RepID=UPI002260BF10|nr:YkoF family thiamine/hydroxymethylpyrimidine-binding protein [Marinicella gelatinilytica]MCX7544137.1 YkoF family thiamine/hydroxymethylpyrimidine-binding protein [Marinicella gelatinilytica]